MTYITVNDDETNYVWQFEGPVDIILDGKRVFGCFEADDDVGFVIKAAYDDYGNVKVNKSGNVVTEHLFGKVEIIGERRQTSWGR